MAYLFSPHIALQVAPYDQAIAFFEQILGLEIIAQGAHESHLRAGNMNFYLEDRGNKPAADPPVFFEFTTEDLGQALSDLSLAGCQLKPTHTPEGAESRFVFTPYGFVFHLWEQKRDARQSGDKA